MGSEAVQPPQLVSAGTVNFDPPPDGTPTAWKIEVYSASHEPELWWRHRQAADQSYLARGLEAVGRDHAQGSHVAPTYFLSASVNGEIIGGTCAHLYDTLNGLPIVGELKGHVDVDRLRLLIDQLMPDGIVHLGGLWVAMDYRRTGLSGDLARAHMLPVVMAGMRYFIATSPEHILEAWATLGYTALPQFPPFPYPDGRYRTRIISGDLQKIPAALRHWLSGQAGGGTLDGSGVRATIQPWRSPISRMTAV
jgi:hypothetical protein